MILLSVQGISRQFDAAPVFKNVSFDVRPGEKIGLVGPNGAGKTTLLRILAGMDEPDTGRIDRHPSVELAMLEQDADFAPGRTLLEEARAGLAHLYSLQHEAAELAQNIAHVAKESSPDQLAQLHRRYDFVQQELHRLDAYNIDHLVDEVLQGLGFRPEEYDRPLTTFSGGQQNRVMLARLLLRAPAVMLLDEPTNHLDIDATEWLENYLAKSDCTIILISHDRYFLDRVTNRILEVFQGAVADYKGNFSAYWSQRKERNKVLERTYEKQQEFIAKTEDFIRRNKYGQKHAQAADREKKLERLDRVDLARDFDTVAMTFGKPGHSGELVIDVDGVAKGFGGEPLFSEFTLRVQRGERIGLLGPNGSGKTTLLRVLLGELPPDRGTVRHGAGVKIGYYDQQLAGVDPGLDAVEAIRPADNPTITPGELRSLLARFGIRGDMAFQKVGSMSGGERSKVALARVAVQNVNLLVLDEPTNHLDLWARDALERALKGFDGTLLFVSHDRYFLDQVATSVVVLEPAREENPSHWKFYEGNYSEYVGFVKNRAREVAGREEGKPAATSERKVEADGRSDEREKPKKRKRRFPYRKVADLEAEILEHEELLEQLEAALADPDVHRDGERAKETLEAFEDTRERLEELYEHWDEAVELN